MNLKSFIISSLTLFSSLAASATVSLTDGAVYRLTNINNSLVITAPAAPGNITATTLNESDSHQLWIAEKAPTGYRLRDLTRGTYMTSPLSRSAVWTTTFSTSPSASTMAFIFPDEADNTSIQAAGYNASTHEVQAGYGHANGSSGVNMVCWGPDAGASRWSIEEVEITADEIANYQKNWFPIEFLPNKVYQIINNVRGHAISATEGHGNVNCVAPDTANDDQLWLSEPAPDGTGYYLRNIRSGAYLSAPLRTAAYWTASEYRVPESTLLDITPLSDIGDLFTILPHGADPNSQNYAHEDDYNRLYSWGKAANQSKWAINLIDRYDEAAIAEARASWAEAPLSEIIPNRVYHITNAHYGKAITANGSNRAVCVNANADYEDQLWVAEQAEGGIILRNFKTGGALTSSMATSQQWTLTNSSTPDPDKSIMKIDLTANGFIFEPASVKQYSDNRKTYGYAHESGEANLVCWESGALPSRWIFTLMDDISEADIEAKRAGWDFTIREGLQGLLDELFLDKTCTELRPEYAGMSYEAIQQKEPFLAMPQLLQEMVLKVHSQDWSEVDPVNPANEWDSEHAKKFRVQMYEPFSNCDATTGMTHIQAYTNFNNPTGILADNGTTLYVMVEKGAKAGSTLYLSDRTYTDNVDRHNIVTEGCQLHEGLNIVQCNRDCALMTVYYNVSTNSGRQRLRKLSDYDDIKIHIEGGSLNGHFNSAGDALYTPDTNEDWFYYRDRARYQRMPLISKYCMLYFDFMNVTADGSTWPGLKNLMTRDEYNRGNFDLNATMEAWDEMFVAEMLIMGLLSDDVIRAEKEAGRDWYDPNANDPIAPDDYAEYFNNRLMGISIPAGFMSATWYRTTYHVNTLRSVVMQFPTMDLWGPAHEFGHLNQGPMKIAGTSEESNNVFSNVALFYRGSHTSRAELPSVHRNNFNKGYNFHQHGTWGTTRMWFQLWLYYHAAGNNKHFYPRLYELLRENPLRKNSTEHLNAKDDLLHFAKMACIAAQEDLTDFFDSWGFLQPQNGYYIGDYTSYTSYLSEEEIEAWRAEIAQMAEENGWKRNSAIIFIDDRVGETSKPGYADFCQPRNAGTMGGLKDFINGTDAVEGEYQFSLSGTTVTVSGGSGGAGFIIYDENGRLIGFANDSPFEVSPETAQKIASGQATFSVVTTDNEEHPVADANRLGSFESKVDAFNDLLARAQAAIARADFSERSIGYLRPDLVSEFKETVDSISALADNEQVTSENISDLIALLNSGVITIESIPLTDANTITIKPGSIYVFTTNKLKGKYGIRPAANGATAIPVAAANIDPESAEQQWCFTRSDDGQGYYIQNVANHKYLRIPSADATALPLSDEPQKFNIRIYQPGFISLDADISDGHRAIHADNNGRIVRWNSGADASLWTIQLIDDADKKANEFALSDLINRAQALLNQAGEINISYTDVTPIDITPASLFTNAPCKVTQYGDGFTSTTWNNLFDNDSSTLFHSDYSEEGTSDGLNHYIRIELPSDTEIDQFLLTYRTRAQKGTAPSNAPAKVLLSASPDAENWTDIALITSGLASTHATDVTLPAFTLPDDTRYVRMMVNEAAPNVMAAGHPYFAISELSAASAHQQIEAFPAEHFSFVTEELMLALHDQISAANLTLASEASSEQLKQATVWLQAYYDNLLNAMNRNSEILSELIADTRALAAEIADITETVTPVSLQAGNYYSNAPYTGSNSDDRFSTWNVLFDNNPATYFHSKYDGNSADGLNHYIRIELPEPTTAEETHLILRYRTRNLATNTYAPAEAVIEYSADGEDWTTAHDLDGRFLPFEGNALFESETFTVPAGTAFVRFTVNKSRRSAAEAVNGTANGHSYFVVSEFGLSTYNATANPYTEFFPTSCAPDVIAALRQCHDAEKTLNAPNTTPIDHDAATQALQPYYDTLLQIKKMAEIVSLDEINATKSDNTIYDLQGRRVKTPAQRGVYIINRNKTIK